jgi:hypothetical protein
MILLSVKVREFKCWARASMKLSIIV